MELQPESEGWSSSSAADLAWDLGNYYAPEGGCDDTGGGWSCSEDGIESLNADIDDRILAELQSTPMRYRLQPGAGPAGEHRSERCEAIHVPAPSLLERVWTRVGRLHEGGVLIQVAGVIVRHVLALYGLLAAFRGFVSWRTVLFAVVLWVVSGLGVTAGAHRLWSHRSYGATPLMEAMLMVMFSIADQGPIIAWCRTHALHHRETDTSSDPHNRTEGFWYSHFGWIYSGRQLHYSSLDEERLHSGFGSAVYFHDAVWLLWDPFWSMGLPSLVASLWGEAWGGFFFAGSFRWACVQHITFLVNSVAHGEREAGADELLFDAAAEGIGPRVSLLTTLLALGEGWHDYHHIFPWDYAAAELDAWHQWNPTKVFIDICSAVGIASNRRRCSPELQQARRRQMLARSMDAGLVENATGQYTVKGPLFFRRRVPARRKARKRL